MSHRKHYTDRDHLQVELMTRRKLSVEQQAATLNRTPRAIYDYQRKAGIVAKRAQASPVCTVAGCGRPSHATSLCLNHYAKRRRLRGQQ